MPDLFLSYSREDRPRAQIIASALMAEGFSVWWDAMLRSGEAYDEVTEGNLRDAAAVIVLWSKTSVKSKWVRAEATLGERHSTLLPAIIEDCERPLRFELIQTADLVHWDGDRTAPVWRAFAADIRKTIGAAAPQHDNIAPAEPNEEDTIETLYWSTIRDSAERAELEAYLKRFVNGRFAGEARARLTALAAASAPERTTAPARAHDQGLPKGLIALAIFAATALIGMAMIVLSNAVHIGTFAWTPAVGGETLLAGAKQIGFIPALNWSLSALVLMPAAWTLLFLAYSEIGKAWSTMARRGMIVDDALAPLGDSDPGLSRLLRHARGLILIGGAVLTLVTIVLALSDYARVAGRFYTEPTAALKLDRLDAEGYRLDDNAIERDWMVAAFLTPADGEAVDSAANEAFSRTAYVIYAGFGIGALLSFGLTALVFGAMFLPGWLQSYGLRLVPDPTAKEPSSGFDSAGAFFNYAFAGALIGAVMCYLMGLQNIYLRSPYENILALLAPDLIAGGGWRDRIDALLGFTFAESVGTGARGAYVWIFGFFIFAVFFAGFLALLRQGAGAARRLALKTAGAQGGDAAASAAKLNTLRYYWPSDAVSRTDCVGVAMLMLASFVFYKLGAIIVPAVCAYVLFKIVRRPAHG